MRPALRIAAVALLIAAAGVGGFLAKRSLDPKPDPLPTLVQSAGHASERVAGETPRRIPSVRLPDIDGAPRDVSEWAGRPLIVNFWATWCEPCRREIPLLESLRRRHAGQRLEVIGIALDFREDVAAYARAAGIDYPILIAEQDAMAAQMFGVGMALPTTVFVNREGWIVASHVGELREEQAGKLLRQILDTPQSTTFTPKSTLMATD